MDVEELRQLWQAQNRRLDEVLRADARRRAESALGRAKTSARRVGWGVLLDLVFAVVPVVWLGSFIADHIAEPAFAIPAAVLDLLAIALLSAYVRQYASLRTLDWTAPVAAIQATLADFRIRRARVARGILFLAPLLWTLMLIVGLKAFLGVDAWAAPTHRFIAANVLFGLVFLAAALWISRRYADRLRNHPFLRERLRDLAGRNLAEAEEYAAEAGGFARGDS